MLKNLNILHLKSFLASPSGYLQSRRDHAQERRVERWCSGDSLQEAWDERTALIAGMIAPASSVLEFGAGKERLRDFLPPGCDYQPSDVVARSAHTLVCDLNDGFPMLNKTWDVIVFSGVLEYIRDVPRLMDHVRAHGKASVLSYASTDGLQCMTTRLKGGWANHLSKDRFEAILRNAQFTIEERKTWNGQDIYRLS